MKSRLFVLALLLGACFPAWCREEPAQPPAIETVAGGAGQPLQLLVYAPPRATDAPRAAIVLFHGGGWTVGEAKWIEPTARLMADVGLVAVSVEYRLADQAETTPYDSVADARAALRWVRRNAQRLGVDPQRIAAGGISAGGHIAASTAVFDEPFGDEVSARPDALVLWSAAVAVGDDGWFARLNGGRARAAALSPDLYVRPGLPPAVMLQGAEDSVTPAAGAERFCQRMRTSGNRCELTVYPGVGHLFTRNLQQQETPDYKAIDLEIDADADRKAIAFLQDIGFAAK
ncbi:MAG: alpha/beta hydrolase [Pseudoxanthomonas sp.]